MSDFRPVAIVTGGAGPGIGHGLSEALAAAGWDLVITELEPERGAALARRLADSGSRIEVVEADVRDADAPERAVRTALARFGRLDGLVNNVGVGLVKKAGEATDEEFMNLFNVDFLASFRFARAALPALVETKGAIVNIGSVHARLAVTKYALYAATKAALEAFTRGLAVDYGPQGVRANIVHPGLVESPQNPVLFERLGVSRQWVADYVHARQCVPRPTTARDIGEMVAFLLGRNAQAVTGQSLFVDGGTSILLWDRDTPPEGSAHSPRMPGSG